MDTFGVGDDLDPDDPPVPMVNANCYARRSAGGPAAPGMPSSSAGCAACARPENAVATVGRTANLRRQRGAPGFAALPATAAPSP